MIEYLTAETARGREAILEVMAHSYVTGLDEAPPRWARARVVDGVPVSFVLVDPDRRMAFPAGEAPFAYLCDVATREDRRGEGHFGAIMTHAMEALRAEGHTMVLTHGRYQLYRRLGFEVFTHHRGIWATADLLERTVGSTADPYARHLIAIDEGRGVQPDLLLVREVRAETLVECRAALQAAARVAREGAKRRILFEHPAAPSYGSRYPIYPTLETPFTALARACGAMVCVQGADPEGSDVPDADWIRVLGVPAFLRVVLAATPAIEGVSGSVALATDAGTATIRVAPGRVVVADEREQGVPAIHWPAAAVAQLATGYCSAAVLAARHDTPLGPEVLALLDALFPPCWRLSRHEGWTYSR